MITPFGLYQVNVLNFGVSTAPSIFQGFISELLEEFGPTVAVLLDDVLMGAPTLADLVALETRVLAKFSEIGLKLNLDKYAFHQREVTYLGHRIDQNGLHMLEDRVAALQNNEPPTNTTSLKSFLGKIGFYERFLENRAAVCAPLYDLLQKGVPGAGPR